jgi:hypothetical protein
MSTEENTFIDQFDQDENVADLKKEFNRIMNELKENPLSIEVEKSEFLSHPSDYVDSRVGIAFIGEFAFFAGLFTEFWSTSSITPYVFTNLTAEQQATFTNIVTTYQLDLQKQEIIDYKQRLIASPTNVDLTDEEIDAKVGNILQNGDKSRLPMNSKHISQNDFVKISFDDLAPESFVKRLAEHDPESKVKLIVFVHSENSQQKIQFSHPSIPTICPQLEITNTGSWTPQQLATFSEFIRSLPDVLQVLM